MGITRLAKGTALAAAILLMGMAAAACGGNGNDDSTLFPRRANVVGSVAVDQNFEVTGLDEDQFLQMLSSGSFGEQDGIGDFLKFDLFMPGGVFGDVSRADIFGDISDGDDAEYFAALLHGSFTESALIAELESVAGSNLVRQDYKGTNVYSPVDDTDGFEFIVLDFVSIITVIT